ncbi:hypothetical protein JS756_06440 [Streptomyces actuosus]|uniref:Protein kinase domain-containing protein n=1 Tax=Streptomyces actuosus TaxID=1885 RepID=A0ABS2VKX0_STRAS|nr:hypothetical protein [Streptomyces actuosus]MBN0043751.1 hypothetical protein [Streptomyces actuosus]
MRTVTSRLGRRYQVEAHPFNDKGGQGLLYRCVDQDGVGRVYKEYKTPVSASSEVHRLHGLAVLGRDIVHRAENGRGVPGRGELATTAESSINWPIDVIHGRNGGVVGVVLPFIPPSFMFTDSNRRLSARTLAFLYLARAEPPPPAAQVRVGVLLRVCDIFKELEDLRLTHGDLSADNLVWREHDTHAYLIDCDGLTPWSAPPAHGVTTQEWTDPRCVAGKIPAHDRFSDRYALALVLYRGLFLNPGGPRWDRGHENGRWIKPAQFPGRLDPELRRMFSRALDDPFATTTRPGAADWHRALHRAFLTGGRPPSYRADALRVLDDYALPRRQEVQRKQAAQRPGATPATGLTVQAPRVQPQPRPQPRVNVRPQVTPPAQQGWSPGPPLQRRPAPAPVPARRRNRTWGIVAAAVAVLAVGGTSAYVFTHDSAAPTTGVPLRAGERCPAPVAARIPDGTGATLLHAYTTEAHRISLCQTVSGKIYYDGSWLHPDTAQKRSEEITVPAERTADGYRARNGSYQYIIRGRYVFVVPPEGGTTKYLLTETS